MWDKETEVDRNRERVPLSNLMSQCKLKSADLSNPKPRDWVGSIKRAVDDGVQFVTLFELKRIEPSIGTLHKRYNVSKMTKRLTQRGIPALCVNCDAIMYGGSMTDIADARQASLSASLEAKNAEDGVLPPPILASDLILYPYQLYKLYLAGADAVELIVGALSGKDLLYLRKIAASLQMQCVVKVTSEEQIRKVLSLSNVSVDAIILSNCHFEDFTIDSTGQQALNLLQSEALNELKQKEGPNFPVFVEMLAADSAKEVDLLGLATGAIISSFQLNDE